MTAFEETLLREVSTLPESPKADILAFVRFLNIILPDSESTRQDFKDALQAAFATAKECNITEENIDVEIRAVRYKSHSNGQSFHKARSGQ